MHSVIDERATDRKTEAPAPTAALELSGMPEDETERDDIGECALHQHREGGMVNVYEGLSDEDRIALARMTTDERPRESLARWSHPPEEL